MEVALQEAARVSVSDELLRSPTLTLKRKRELRTIALFDLIKSRPYGTRIKYREIAKACHVNGDGAAQGFVKVLIKHGKLIEHQIDPMSRKEGLFYVVPGTVNASPPAFESTAGRFTLKELKAKAANYVWDNNVQEIDRLKDFLIYLENSVD